MPIIIEHLVNPTDQDKVDLLKIYRDYPFPLPTSPEQWLEQQLDKQQLWAGRFNDRLLTAAAINTGNDSWELDQLCVRTITRRRGTARQFLTLLAKRAAEHHATLSINTSLSPDILEPLLESCDFHQQADFLWQK